MTKLYIKNMVCNRCVMAVKQVADKLDLNVLSVTMGELELGTTLNPEQDIQLRSDLKAIGFEVLDSQKQKTIEKIKNIIIKEMRFR